ncbi:MAG: dTDP-4-dehydrorhamnose 3,5-epimerase family protein, partial [Flavobacteriales bacterium]|nr:dTDP-4-dehydrorhamnose 3,5-epimerase family protein [Flavobacteriales bacterium]
YWQIMKSTGLENGTVFLYKCTDTYSPEHEGSVLWNDPLLAIDWNVDAPILSAKDQDGPAFTDFNSPFIYEK